jgi:Domain of unknown function (DUF4157)
MEPQLGTDLSGVKVHTGGDSAEAATQFGARAFTVGQDVHFGAGEYAPGTKEGDRLIAHELTHAVQGQRSGISRKADEHEGNADGQHPTGAEMSQPGEPAELEADATADKVADNLHGGDAVAAAAGDHAREGKGGAQAEKRGEAPRAAIAAKLEPNSLPLARKTTAPATAGQSSDHQNSANLPPRIQTDAQFQRAAHAVEAANQQPKQGAPAGAKIAEPAKDGDKKDAGEEGDKKPKPEEMTGIGATVAVGRFVTAAKKIQGDWAKLKPADRASGMAKASNDELTAVGVPAVDPRLEDIQEAGRLNFREWALRLGKPPFSKTTVNDAEAASMADTVYHESRHAEQWHRMARVQAGKGKKPQEIANEMQIPPKIAADAATKPLDSGKKEGAEAQGFYDSVYGKDAAYRNKVLTDLRTKGEARQKAQAEYEKIVADPKGTPEKTQAAKDAWVKAYNEWKSVYNDYTALPEEADAWKVGGAVTNKYLGKT